MVCVGVCGCWCVWAWMWALVCVGVGVGVGVGVRGCCCGATGVLLMSRNAATQQECL